MGESGRGFGLKFIRKSKLKKILIFNKRKLSNMMDPNFLYSSMLLIVTRLTRMSSKKIRMIITTTIIIIRMMIMKMFKKMVTITVQKIRNHHI